MRILPQQIANYLENIANQTIVGCLLYGNDDVVMASRFRNIAKKIIVDTQDPFLAVNIGGANFGTNSDLLIEEFLSGSMLGGRKVIMLRELDSGQIRGFNTSLLQNLQQLESRYQFKNVDNNFILIYGGDLAKNSPLRQFAEDSKSLAAIACYQESKENVVKMVNARLQQLAIELEQGSLELLLSSGNYQLENCYREIEKIDIFLGEKIGEPLDKPKVNSDSKGFNGSFSTKNIRKLLIVDALKIFTNQQESSLIDFVNSLLGKKTYSAIECFNRLLHQELDFIMLVRYISSYFQKLYFAKIDSSNQNVDEFIRKNNIFFKEADAFKGHLREINVLELEKIMQKTLILEARLKNSEYDSNLVFIDFIRSFS